MSLRMRDGVGDLVVPFCTYSQSVMRLTRRAEWPHILTVELALQVYWPVPTFPESTELYIAVYQDSFVSPYEIMITYRFGLAVVLETNSCAGTPCS
jgi:hypothetical protein